MDNTRTTKGAGQRETGQSSRLSQNSSTGPNGRPGGSAPQGTSPTGRVSWLRWLIFIIVINLFFYAPLLLRGLGAQQSTINLSYTSFLQQVQNGNVKDVTLSGNAVSGDFKTPLHQQQGGSGNGTATYSQFTSYVPETGDPNLLPSLEKYRVSVTAQPVQIPWWQTALTILLNALPILLLVYFGYMALRGLRQSQQGGGIFGAVLNCTTKSVHPPPSPTWQEPTKPRPTCARKSTSCVSRSATSLLGHIFPKVCCWLAHQVPARPCSLVPSQARQVSLSIVQVAQTSSNCSSGSGPAACAISLSR